MGTITPKQQKIYDFIQSFTAEHGYPPSVREIGAAMGLKSPSTVHFHLKGLEEAGMIVKAEGKTRAITLPAAPNRAVAEESNARADRIPVVGSVAAGSPILAEECIEDYLTFDTQGLSGEHFALKVRGESMVGAGILPNDLVVVHRQQEAHSGEIVVALFEDEATVKTLRRRDGHVWLMPENPAYDPIDGTHAQVGPALLSPKLISIIGEYGTGASVYTEAPVFCHIRPAFWSTAEARCLGRLRAGIAEVVQGEADQHWCGGFQALVHEDVFGHMES